MTETCPTCHLPAHRCVTARHLHQQHVANLTDRDLRETDSRWNVDPKETTGRGDWTAPGLRGYPTPTREELDVTYPPGDDE